MFRLNLGSGAQAFEVEGQADRVSSLNPDDLVKRDWPPEMVENVRRYQARLKHSDAMKPSNALNRFDAEVQSLADMIDLSETDLLEVGKGTVEDKSD
jgi:hypothetical protein